MLEAGGLAGLQCAAISVVFQLLIRETETEAGPGQDWAALQPRRGSCHTAEPQRLPQPPSNGATHITTTVITVHISHSSHSSCFSLAISPRPSPSRRPPG